MGRLLHTSITGDTRATGGRSSERTSTCRQRLSLFYAQEQVRCDDLTSLLGTCRPLPASTRIFIDERNISGKLEVDQAWWASPFLESLAILTNTVCALAGPERLLALTP